MLHECQQHSVTAFEVVVLAQFLLFRLFSFFNHLANSLNSFAVKFKIFTSDTTNGAVYSSEAEY